MLCYSEGQNIPKGLFSDIYKDKIWQIFSINLANSRSFFVQHTLDSYIGLVINVYWF
jgi:hypothetical protein